MVSQHWCHDGVMMMLWQCHATVKIKIPTKSRVWTSASFSFWVMFFWVQSSQKGSKVTNTRKNHPKSSRIILSHSLGPHLKLSILYWLDSDSEVPHPTKHVCPWMKQTPMASYRFVFGTIAAPVKDTITASYQFHGTITAPVKDTITASYQFHGTITAPIKDTITASSQFHGTITAPQETRFITPINNRYDCYLGETIVNKYIYIIYI